MFADDYFKTGDRVVDGYNREGLVTMSYGGEYEIRWANGATVAYDKATIRHDGIDKLSAVRR